MPFYEYRCMKCGEVMEILQRIGDNSEGVQCSQCGSKDCEKLMSVSSFLGASSSLGEPSGGCVPQGGFS